MTTSRLSRRLELVTQKRYFFMPICYHFVYLAFMWRAVGVGFKLSMSRERLSLCLTNTRDSLMDEQMFYYHVFIMVYL